MKQGIHPENYRVVVFKDMSDGTQFFSRSCANTKDTIEIDGQTYPLIKLEISNTSHPFYTGKSKLVDEDAGQRSSEVDQLQVMVTDLTVLLEQVEATHLHVVVRDDRGYPPLAEALVLADDGVAGVADIIEDALGLHLGIYLFGDVALIDLLKYVGTLLGKRTRAREQAAV